MNFADLNPEPYEDATQNFVGSWLNPRHDSTIQKYSQPMAFLSNGSRLPAKKMQDGSILKSYRLFKEFEDNGPAFVIRYDPFFGHTILDTLTWIAFVIKRMPEAKIILIASDYQNRQNDTNYENLDRELVDLKKKSEKIVYDFTLSLLEKNKINYESVYLDTREFIIVNNVLVISDSVDYHIKSSATAAMICLINETFNIAPKRKYKKVYLSRSKVAVNDFVHHDENQNKKYRIIDEKRLEDFLSTLGFDIVYPEDFDSFEDQIRFFGDVSVLMGCTTSSLNNQLWMENNGTVIELCTPMYMSDHYEIHTHYQSLASFKAHNFLRVPILNKDAAAIIEYLQNNKEILNMLEHSK